MHTNRLRPRDLATCIALALAALACNLQLGAPAPVEAPPTHQVAALPTLKPPAPASATAQTATSTSQPTATTQPTATVGPAPVVTITAAGGRLNVRRGPGPDYDTVGAFLNGQSSLATARNQDGTWVLIDIPGATKPLGWITLETKYTTITGAVAALPLQSVDPAKPAYIRNCTGREMLVNPLGALLLPLGSAPDNQLQLFPGEYTIVDQTTDTELGGVTAFEGRTIDINQDSSGKKSFCP